MVLLVVAFFLEFVLNVPGIICMANKSWYKYAMVLCVDFFNVKQTEITWW